MNLYDSFSASFATFFLHSFIVSASRWRKILWSCVRQVSLKQTQPHSEFVTVNCHSVEAHEMFLFCFYLAFAFAPEDFVRFLWQVKRIVACIVFNIAANIKNSLNCSLFFSRSYCVCICLSILWSISCGMFCFYRDFVHCFPVLQSFAFDVINYVRLRKYVKLHHLFNFTAQPKHDFFSFLSVCVVWEIVRKKICLNDECNKTVSIFN